MRLKHPLDLFSQPAVGGDHFVGVLARRGFAPTLAAGAFEDESGRGDVPQIHAELPVRIQPTRRRPRECQGRAAHQPHFEHALVQPRKERQIFFDGGAAFGKSDGDDGGFQRTRFADVNGAAVELSLAACTRGPHLIEKRIVHHADH